MIQKICGFSLVMGKHPPQSTLQTALEKEVEMLRTSVNNLRSNLQMGMEIEIHLKKVVHNLKNKKISLEEKTKKDISALRNFHSQHRLDIVNLLEEEFSQFKSVINAIKENMRQVRINGEVNHLSPQRDMTLQENDCRDVHISPDAGSDTITKENVFGLTSISASEVEGGSKVLPQMLKEKENISDFQKTCSSSGTGNACEPLAQAMQEKVEALLLLSQQEEIYLLESNVNAALRSKLEELQRNLMQVTNEKVVALMELAQLKQEHRLLQEKLDEGVKRGNVLTDVKEKNMIQDKDGKLKSLLKKTYFGQWGNPLSSHGSQEYAQNVDKKSSSSTMDFARMKIEYIALKESLESMEHLTSSIRRLRLSLVKVKECVPGDDTVARKSEIIENVGTEARLLKTALGSSLPVSWSVEEDGGISSAEKVDCVSAAGFEMVELLILSSQLLKSSIV